MVSYRKVIVQSLAKKKKKNSVNFCLHVKNIQPKKQMTITNTVLLKSPSFAFMYLFFSKDLISGVVPILPNIILATIKMKKNKVMLLKTKQLIHFHR